MHRLASTRSLGFAILLLCIGVLACQPPARAQPAANGKASRNRLTGDWSGLRTRLQDAGVTFNLSYASESAGIVAGKGLRHTARYTQQLELETLFDLERLAGVPDAKIQFTVTDRKGRSLTNDVLHNQFSVQELYGAGQNFRLAELNYQQDSENHRIHTEIC